MQKICKTSERKYPFQKSIRNLKKKYIEGGVLRQQIHSNVLHRGAK